MSQAATTCVEIAAAVRSGQHTAASVVDGALALAERLQPDWKAFITLVPELARRQAERVDKLVGEGKPLPLAGVPFAVKDVIHVEGVPTTCGSKAFADVAERNATVVDRLMAAGGVPLGKTNMHECAFGFTGANATFGDGRNPWDPSRVTGGSSSGSSLAVALGICPLALGSDTGGSIRLPAALCGLVGLKPTYGRASRAGVVPLSWSMDHVGPMTRTAKEAALALEALAGEDPDDDTSSPRPVPGFSSQLDDPLDGLKIGLPRAGFFESLEPAVAEAVEAARAQMTTLGAECVDVTLPYLDEVLGAHRAIIFSEAASYHQPFLADRADRYGDDVRVQLEAGLLLPAVDYLKGQRVRRVVRRAWAEAFAPVDCLLTPASQATAVPLGQRAVDLPGGETPLLHAYLGLSLPFNLTGHPAISVPCGFSAEGLPIGMQIVGKPFDETTILRVAHQYQQHTDWHRRTGHPG
ncbi:MAG: amidase [Planctomycetota bacterium]|jgi:aspartyl-tRNA(Asn)/glutamyl-tRNA(Gln) amidotransferase subunit A